MVSTAGDIAFEPISTWAPDFVAAIRRHYTGSRGAPPGKKLAWRIWEDDRVVGYIGLGEPSFKLAPRRRLQGRDAEEDAVLQAARPLPGTATVFIYRLEGPHETSASDLLQLWEDAAVEGWLDRYGIVLEHLETMIGQGEEVPGYSFRRAGWRSLGHTTGRGARRPAGATHSARVWGPTTPKLVLYRGPLHRRPKTRENPARPHLSASDRALLDRLEREWLEAEALAGVAHDAGDHDAEEALLAQAAEAEAALAAVAEELEEVTAEERYGERGAEEELVGERVYEGVEHFRPEEQLRGFYALWVKEWAAENYGIDHRDVCYSRLADFDTPGSPVPSPAVFMELLRSIGHWRRAEGVTDLQLAEAARDAYLSTPRLQDRVHPDLLRLEALAWRALAEAVVAQAV